MPSSALWPRHVPRRSCEALRLRDSIPYDLLGFLQHRSWESGTCDHLYDSLPDCGSDFGANMSDGVEDFVNGVGLSGTARAVNPEESVRFFQSVFTARGRMR